MLTAPFSVSQWRTVSELASPNFCRASLEFVLRPTTAVARMVALSIRLAVCQLLILLLLYDTRARTDAVRKRQEKAGNLCECVRVHQVLLVHVFILLT